MLVLSRKTKQQIQIGTDITVTILSVKGQTVRLGIAAPDEVRVLRSELPDATMPRSPWRPPAVPTRRAAIPAPRSATLARQTCSRSQVKPTTMRVGSGT